jgi:hypothetical protein
VLRRCALNVRDEAASRCFNSGSFAIIICIQLTVICYNYLSTIAGHKLRHDPCARGKGVCLARCGGLLAMEGDNWTELVRQTENIWHFECRVLGVRTVGNIFRMRSSSNSSLTTKSCVCVSVSFLAGNISWSVDSNYSCQLYSIVDCPKRSCELTYRINVFTEWHKSHWKLGCSVASSDESTC